MSLGPGPQWHPPNNIFWNLLGSTDQITQSAAGLNGAEVGSPAYRQGYNWPDFGNSVEINSNNEAIIVPNAGQTFIGAAGCIEIFVYPDGWTITNGVASGGNRRYMLWERSLVGGNNLFVAEISFNGFWTTLRRNGVDSGL